MLGRSMDQFSRFIKGPAEILTDGTGLHKFRHLVFGEKSIAMQWTSETHIPDANESDIDLIRELFDDPIEPMVTPLFSLLR
jgi:hypothetical protein